MFGNISGRCSDLDGVLAIFEVLMAQKWPEGNNLGRADMCSSRHLGPACPKCRARESMPLAPEWMSPAPNCLRMDSLFRIAYAFVNQRGRHLERAMVDSNHALQQS